jgi:pyruvate kinase
MSLAVLLDTKGPEIRSGFFADGAKKIDLVKGQNLVLTSDYSFMGNNEKLACSYASLAKSVKPGQSILVGKYLSGIQSIFKRTRRFSHNLYPHKNSCCLADGSLVLTVKSVDEAAGEVTCNVENTVSIGERKNMNLPGVVVDLPTLTDKDISDIVEWGIPQKIDFIAASFVRKASDVTKIREILGPDNQGIKIISKIENQEGMENYDAILKETDGIMVARGDVSNRPTVYSQEIIEI